MSRAPRSIVLIGFMGTGKSSIGRLLAAKRGWPRFDTDEMIACALGMSVTQIFNELGEERFRAEESKALERCAVDQPSIIVTGGGIVLRPPNIARLRALGTVVCLTANLPTLLQRLARRPDRPLLQTGDLSETVQTLLRRREPLYKEAADLMVDTSLLTHDQVARSIQEFLDARVGLG